MHTNISIACGNRRALVITIIINITTTITINITYINVKLAIIQPVIGKELNVGVVIYPTDDEYIPALVALPILLTEPVTPAMVSTPTTLLCQPINKLSTIPFNQLVTYIDASLKPLPTVSPTLSILCILLDMSAAYNAPPLPPSSSSSSSASANSVNILLLKSPSTIFGKCL